MKTVYYIILIPLFFYTAISAGDETEKAEQTAQLPRGQYAFDQGNTAYNAKEYDKAIRLYTRARTTGFTPGALHYNLGNAYYRKGELGRAIAEYLKAQQLIPRNDDVRENLATARSQTDDNIHPAQPPAALRSFLFLYYYLSPDELLWLAAIFCALLFLTLTLHTLLPRKLFATSAFVLAFLMLITAGTGGVKTYLYTTPTTAVVTASEAIARAGPGDTYGETFVLHDGTEAKVKDMQNSWVKIEVTKRKGWVPARSVTLL